MRQVQLYIEDKRIDLFDDESIEVKSSIQDARDISKVFTDYSQTFSIPASSTNNKIFKHFYNHNIDGGFDARVRHEAKIYINTLLFKKGKIFLEGVDMKNNVAHTYRIKFYGNTVSLKDKFKDNKLSSLDLSSFDYEFSHNNVENIFLSTGKTVNGDDSALIFPLITPKKRLFYDSSLSSTSNQNFTGNLYAPNSFPTDPDDLKLYALRGVNEGDLKPAIKIYHIIKAIEDKFDIVLIPNDNLGTKDFLSIHNEAISNLYMWISNSSGSIIDNTDEDNYFYTGIPTTFGTHAQSDQDFVWLSENNGEFTIKGGGKDGFSNNTINSYRAYDFDFKIHVNPTPTYSNINWMVKLVNKETGRYQVIKGVGSKKALVTIPYDLEEDQVYYIEFSSEAAMSETEIIFEAREDNGDFLFWWNQPSDFEMYTTKFGSNVGFATNQKNITIKNELPDMKIIDFITGLFKMFNLTAYVIDDETDAEYGTDLNGVANVIKITTLDNYYADAINNQSKGTIDVTKYIDVSSNTVNTSLPFSEIMFSYEENNTVIKKNHLDTFGESFGDSSVSLAEEYPDTDFFFGEIYEVKLPFTILKYERIEGTNIQWGYAAGGDFQSKDGDFSDSSNPVIPEGDYSSENIKPLLFYGVRETTDTPFLFGSVSGTQAGRITSQYYRPSNTNETVVVDGGGAFTTPPSYSLTFDAEIDEFVLNDFGRSSNSLFNKFYKNYIKSVFDKNKRIFKFNAYLPPSVLVNYKLNDQLKVHDVVYRINSITTNLTTGKTELELINLTSDEII